LEKPSRAEMQEIAKLHHFNLTEEELPVYAKSVEQGMAAFERLNGLHAQYAKHDVRPTTGHRPSGQENPFGAWAWKTSIQASSCGPLHGKSIAIKDNVAVAGLPMLNGSPLLEGFVPAHDATVVDRILSAGGEIVGKAVSENLCFSGGSHTSYPFPVLNPHDPLHMSGGSSSGSAVLVATGACDMAIGGDQGGSVRIPSSWCGIYGLKPTWGLVPYTGAFPIEPSLDHLGPMARSVEEVALLLEVIGGRDGLDARQCSTPFSLESYQKSLAKPARQFTIGVLKEGFGWSGISDGAVDDRIHAAADEFARLGARMVDVSVPMHLHGLDIWSGIATEGAWSTMVRGNSLSHGPQGFLDDELISFYAQARKTRGAEFSPTVKSVILLGEYLDRQGGGRFYARAQNLRRILRAAYDDALRDVDLLLMPTTPRQAPRFPDDDGLEDYLEVALNMMQNTATFDASGHPAMSIPCGKIGRLPTGMTLVGRHFDEATILAAAHLFEQGGFNQAMQ